MIAQVDPSFAKSGVKLASVTQGFSTYYLRTEYCVDWPLINKYLYALISNESIWPRNGEKWKFVPHNSNVALIFPRRGGFRCQTHPHFCC
jgi:hypothetical protein